MAFSDAFQSIGEHSLPASATSIATVVTDKAIQHMLESGGQGSYRDEHPWLVARDLLQASDQQVPILFASSSEQGIEFSYWSVISDIDVVELHRGQWDTRVSFGQLTAMNPIWSEIDSVFVQPSELQLAREQREHIRVVRTGLDEHHIHPYAICETPSFIVELLNQ